MDNDPWRSSNPPSPHQSESKPAVPQDPASQQPEKTPVIAHICCGWPFLMVLFGGMIGGALGGVAYGVNVAVYGSNLPMPVKVLAIIASGFIAFGIWLAIAVAIAGFRAS